MKDKTKGGFTHNLNYVWNTLVVEVFTIEGHNPTFALRDGKLNKWLQHFFKHLHV
jgi:hypothetical protein